MILARSIWFLSSSLLPSLLQLSFLDLMHDTCHNAKNGVDGTTGYQCKAIACQERLQAIFTRVWF